MWSGRKGDDSAEAFVAHGGDFPDALGAPILLSRTSRVDPSVAGIRKAFVFGGSGIVGDGVADRLGAHVQ